MRRLVDLEYDAPTTQGALRRMRRIRQGVIGGARAQTRSESRLVACGSLRRSARTRARLYRGLKPLKEGAMPPWKTL